MPRYIICGKRVDITFSAHDAFLEWPWSGTLKIERFESAHDAFLE